MRFCYIVCFARLAIKNTFLHSYIFLPFLRGFRPLKRPDRPSKRKCRKRGLSIPCSLVFRLVVLFSIVYTVYQFVPSHKSKSNLLSKYYAINIFPHFVLNSYYSVSYRIIIYLVTFYFVISIHKLETCLH